MKHLKYIDALDQHGHFGKAAAACFVSQPALSQQIKELEAIVDAPLVDRTSRQIQLTAQGREMADRARSVLLAVDELEDAVRASRDELTGTFRLGIIPTVAPYTLPRFVRAINERFPAVDIRPREATTSLLLADLMNNALDAAILALPVEQGTYEAVPLFEEPFVLVRPMGDAGQPVPNPAQLSQMRLLLLEEGHCFRDQALAFCELDGARPTVRMEGSSLSTLVQMVGANLGVTLIPRTAIPMETRGAEVCVDQFPEPAPVRQIGLVWRGGNPLSSHYRDVGETLEALKLGRSR